MLKIDIRKFCDKYDVIISEVKSLLRNMNLSAESYRVEMTRKQYKFMLDYFRDDSQLTALVFYNYGRCKTDQLKNVIKLIKPRECSYVYVWYRYMIMNSMLTRVKIGEISIDELYKFRVWRNGLDVSTMVILNERDELEAVQKLPVSTQKNT